MKIAFIDYLDLAGILSLLPLQGRYEKIYCFGISAPARLLAQAGLRRRMERIDFRLSSLKGKDGEALSAKIYGTDLINICDLLERSFEKNEFIGLLAGLFGFEKTAVFFRKLAATELVKIIAFMNAAVIITKKNDAETEFMLPARLFSDELKGFAMKEYGITLRARFSFGDILMTWSLLIKGLLNILRTLLESFGSRLTGNGRSKGQKRPLIGTDYSILGVTLDKDERSDSPWLVTGKIDYNRVLVYFKGKDEPGAEDILLMNKHGIRYSGLSKWSIVSSARIPRYAPTPAVAGDLSKRLAGLWLPALKIIARMDLGGMNYVARGLAFVNHYCRMYDFCQRTGMKVMVDRNDYDPYVVAERLAVRDSGGISISYQQSTFGTADPAFGSSADVFFMFGPYYRPMIARSGSDISTIAYTGFIADYSFDASRVRSAKMRSSLERKGADFIVAYFDENSSDKPMTVSTHEQSVAIYRKLFEWVISDERLGLICSPKKPSTLAMRIRKIKTLMEKAKETGRCVFVEGDQRTYSWPAEAIMASDFTIGSMTGGSTVFEAFLAGKRSAYIDWEGLYSYAEYKNGRDKVVFDDIAALIGAINGFRRGVPDFKAIGDPSCVWDIIETRDGFRDGHAADRIAEYIGSVLTSFDKGLTGEEAIDAANREYANKWGANNIVYRGSAKAAEKTHSLRETVCLTGRQA